jgi:hypothetical protein
MDLTFLEGEIHMIVGQDPRKTQDNILHLDGIRKFASGYRHIASLLNFE